MPRLAPPKAARRDYVHVQHGDHRPDPYHWLSDRDDPETLAYLTAENDYTKAQMANTQALQESLFESLKARIQETDCSLPYLWRGWAYYSRTEAGLQYPISCRRPQTGGDETVLLDGNRLAADEAYFALGALEVSPDQALLAYASDTQGDEIYRIELRRIGTTDVLEAPLEHCAGTLVWTEDNLGFYYSTLDECQRPHQLWYHRLGESQDQDRLIFSEPDGRFFLGAYKSKSEQLIFIELSSKESNEVWFAPSACMHTEFTCLCLRRPKHEYYVDHDGQRLLIRSNDLHPNYRLLGARTDTPTDWQELIAAQDHCHLEDVEPFRNHLVLSERIDGQVRLVIVGAAGQQTIEFPDACYSAGLGSNIDLDADFVRIYYESLNRPAQVIDVDLQSARQTLRKQKAVLGPFDPNDYLCKRLHATAADGTRIPISLVGQRGSFAQPAPLYLYGYGAYGDALDPWFSHARLNLLERGVIFAIAHVRGGGDLGEHWYQNGKLEHKEHSFGDFIACLEFLQAEGITRPEQTLISGGSAGGLLIGTVINRAPERICAAIAEVPFVDVLSTMLDPNLPLTLTEYEEWGNPNQPEVYRRIKQYSPVDNVAPQAYPHLLVTAGLSDPRVPYWEAAKWVAKLRHEKTDQNLLLLKTNLEAGHGGASGRYEAMQETAFEQAFVLKVLGLGD